LENGCQLVQKVSELPRLFNIKELFLDIESQSFERDRGGLQWYMDDRIAGIAVTVNDDNESWYIPYRHTDKDWNLDLEPVQKWLKEVVGTCTEWINHNVCFDAHFCAVDNAEFGWNTRLIDTLVLAKLHDTDRFTGFGLKPLCRDWLEMPMEEVDRVKIYLAEIKSKNFADIPADILGAYACEDVIGNRKLYRFLDHHCADDQRRVWENEIRLTPVMYDMEKFGMPVDIQELKIEKFKSLKKQIMYGDRLHEIYGQELNPNSPKDVYDMIINKFGLPVLAVTEDTGNPSFDKEALARYVVHPAVIANPTIKEAITTLKAYRDEAHFMSLFVEPYLQLNRNSIMHPAYNQLVRTGRMSCRKPNGQQLNTRAKRLIHPFEGMAILSCDFSQIEFRLIVHYIQDAVAIKAYNDDPTTDFHQWVADLCKIKRKPAKRVNFGIAFGAGKKKALSMLSQEPDVIEEVSKEVNRLIDQGSVKAEDRNIVFSDTCRENTENIYNTYHERLPGIKRTSYKATKVAKRRGYVFNEYGRRRHIPAKFCYKAFNSIIQSCAADVMKDAILQIAPRYNKWVRDLGINIFALVHDDICTMGPKEVMEDSEIQLQLKTKMENVTQKFRVPIIMEMAFSAENWGDVKQT